MMIGTQPAITPATLNKPAANQLVRQTIKGETPQIDIGKIVIGILQETKKDFLDKPEIQDFKEEVLYVLNHQIAGGMCFLRITDTTQYSTIQLIYLLCACYENVHICKPRAISNTSLVKYIVCTQFKKIVHIDNYDKLIIPYYFITKINELNAMYGQIQFEHLQYNDESKEKWIHWCTEFSIPI